MRRDAERHGLVRTFSQKRVAAQKMQPQYGNAGSADIAVLWLHLCGCEEVQRWLSHKIRAAGRHAVIGIVTLGRSCTCNKPLAREKNVPRAAGDSL